MTSKNTQEVLIKKINKGLVKFSRIHGTVPTHLVLNEEDYLTMEKGKTCAEIGAQECWGMKVLKKQEEATRALFRMPETTIETIDNIMFVLSNLERDEKRIKDIAEKRSYTVKVDFPYSEEVLNIVSKFSHPYIEIVYYKNKNILQTKFTCIFKYNKYMKDYIATVKNVVGGAEPKA